METIVNGPAAVEWEIKIADEGGVKSVSLNSSCVCGNILKESVTMFSRISQVTCRLCGTVKVVPVEILSQAVSERTRIMSESAEIRMRHGGSGLLIPD